MLTIALQSAGDAMMPWNSDEELFTLVERELFTSVVGDVMDRMHLVH
jgi:hypothetical protein